jgi:hypothetical protein
MMITTEASVIPSATDVAAHNLYIDPYMNGLQGLPPDRIVGGSYPFTWDWEDGYLIAPAYMPFPGNYYIEHQELQDGEWYRVYTHVEKEYYYDSGPYVEMSFDGVTLLTVAETDAEGPYQFEFQYDASAGDGRKYWEFQSKAGTSAKIDYLYIMPMNPLGSGDQYNMPTNLETLNWRTCTAYETAKTDESFVEMIPYEEWRMNKDTLTTAATRPTKIAERPDGVLQLWPEPDKYYTLRYDGVLDIDEMVLDTDTPGFNIAGTTTLPDRYHSLLVYGAALKYAEHHDDTKEEDIARKYRALHARLTEKQTPPVTIPAGVLTGTGNSKAFWRY